MNEIVREVKVLPTYYDGTKFRSRLEARWAIFFDYLRIPYRYEYEGFDLDGVWYVPDFYLPKQDYWIEVKPVSPSEKEQDKCERLAKATETSTYCFWDIPRPWDGSDDGPAYAWRSEWYFNWDNCHNFIQCHNCGAIRIEYYEHSYWYCNHCDSEADNEAKQLKMAYEVARRFRFDNFKIIESGRIINEN